MKFPTDEQVEAAAKVSPSLYWPNNCFVGKADKRAIARTLLTAALAPEFIAQIVAAHSEPQSDFTYDETKWKLVPVEPDDNMRKAMEEQWMCGSQIDMAEREYKAALAAAPEHPADDAIVRDATALRWMAKHPECELSADFGPDGDEDLQWVVHRVAGSRNDREWHELGRGATPMRAISAAMQANKQEQR